MRSLMPQGVEHTEPISQMTLDAFVHSSLMPQGVEHTEYTGEVANHTDRACAPL